MTINYNDFMHLSALRSQNSEYDPSRQFARL